ncbi:MAG: hypothetical protein IH851_03095 [Armatimonadetes bacterium]|nr:hypothetical protein [Armatimonadota bacterium]
MGIKFRRIFWVTEQFDDEGFSEVTGIYTSVPDLIETGLGTRVYGDKKAGFRITLCALDTTRPPLLSFSSPDFQNVEAHLAQFVESGEMSSDEVARLAEALRRPR